MKKVELKPGVESFLRKGLYTVYSKWVKADASVSNGDFVEVYYNDELIGYGFYEKIGAIGLRVLAYLRENPPDSLEEIIKWRIRKAFSKRRLGGEKPENGYRLIYADSDGMPGLIADVYNDVCVIQSTSYGWDRNLELLGKIIADEGIAERVYLKNDQRARKTFGLPVEKRFIIGGGEARTVIIEDRARFMVDFENGHKTGFYLDQRPARLRIAQMRLDGLRVLDLFSYTGAFAIQALLAGAEEATLVEENLYATMLAHENLVLNGVRNRAEILRCRVEKFLDTAVAKRKRYDVVIADPPAFIPSLHHLERGTKAYEKLYENIMKVVDSGGYVYASSCSFHLSREKLLSILVNAASKQGLDVSLVFELSEANATPYTRIVDEELRYLKGFLLQVE